MMKRGFVFILLLGLCPLSLSQSGKSPPPGPTPPGVRLDSWKRHEELANRSLFGGLIWRAAGPRFQGGRIECITGVPGRPSVIYAGAGSGGVWKSANGGATWKPIFDSQPTQAIGDIEVCPSDPRIIWVGTGESLLSRSSFAGMGVFKSTDGGETWRNMGLPDSQHIGRIAVLPGDPDIAYVAVMGHSFTPNEERGLYKTIDGGETWKKVLYVDEKTGVADVVLDPSDPRIVYAAAWQKMKGKGSGIYKSVDGGDTWTRLGRGLPSGDLVGRIGLDVSRSDPNIVYALIDNNAPLPERNAKSAKKEEKKTSGAGLPAVTIGALKGMSRKEFLAADRKELSACLRPTGVLFEYRLEEITNLIRRDVMTPARLAECLEKYWIGRGPKRKPIKGAEVYRSDDRGETWRKTHAGPLYFFSAIGWSFCDIRVSPENPNLVYALGVTLQRSEDGGKTFHEIRGRIVHVLENKGRTLHLDQHDLWIDPADPKRLLLGNDGGIFLSRDRGAVWVHANMLPIAEFYRIATDRTAPYRIFGGTQDNSHVFGPGTADVRYPDRDPWDYVWLDLWSGGDGLAVMPDPDDGDVVFYAQQNGELHRKNMRTGSVKTLRPRRDLCEPPLRFDWNTPFFVSAHDPDRVYCAANRVFRSGDDGETWSPVSPDLTLRKREEKPKGRITALAESPLDPRILCAGTDGGLVHVTRDGGGRWKAVFAGIPERKVSCIALSRFEKGRIYLSLTGRGKDDFSTYLYRSDDFGETWKSMAAGLPAEPVNVVREDPKKGKVLYAGTDLGVYASLDRGGSWNSLCKGLPPASVMDLTVHPETGELIIGTHGRSAFVLDVRPLQLFDEEVAAAPLYLFPIRPARLPRRRDFSGDFDFETVREAAFTFFLREKGKAELHVTNSAGEEVFRWAGVRKRGCHTVVFDLVRERPRLGQSAYRSGTRFFPPGIYHVVLEAGEAHTSGEFSIESS